MPVVQAARALRITVVTSAALLEGHLGRKLPEFVTCTLGLEDNLPAALHFARSSPGIDAALVGMSRTDHLERDLRLVEVDPVSREQLARLFDRRT